MPFICLRRTDLDPGVLQVLDLKPNSSQRSLIYEPPGQTKYVSFRPQEDAVFTSGAGPILTVGEYKGLAAYLIDHVEAGGLAAGTAALPAADANTIAAAIVAALDAGSAMTLVAVNALISATVASSELTNAGGSASTGSLDEFLRILSGEEYTLPAGSQVEDGGNLFDPTVSGSFTPSRVRRTYDGGALTISLAEGKLAGFTNANFTYQGVTGAALVVYGDDGAVL